MARKQDQEQQERLQRMLAREQGLPPPAPAHGAEPPSAPGPLGRAVRRASRPDLPKRPTAAVRPAPEERPANTRPVSPILRRRQRRRRLTLAALALGGLVVLAGMSGILGQLALALRDVADSTVLYFNRTGGGWPADTGIVDPLRAEALAGGFVVMDSEDVAVYSAYGKRIRAVQPGYARPCLAMGGSRFVVYNRSGTELRVESRTETLYTRTTANGILLCALSGNGNLAVLTQDDRYAAVLEVLDAAQNDLITYSLTQDAGVPVALRFAADNRRLACGSVTAQGGRMQSLVYLMDTAKAELGPFYRADAGSLILELHWLGQNRVLAVFDTYAALLDKDAVELARYSYGGAVLQNTAIAGRQAALLLADRGSNTLVTLDEQLRVLADVAAPGARAVAATATDIYLLEENSVACFGYDGALRGREQLDTRPQAVLDAAETLVLAGGVARPLAAQRG